VIAHYRGRARWSRHPQGGYVLDFQPQLEIPAYSMATLDLPPPADLGGQDEFGLEIEFYAAAVPWWLRLWDRLSGHHQPRLKLTSSLIQEP
jgi:hypothetical protein